MMDIDAIVSFAIFIFFFFARWLFHWWNIIDADFISLDERHFRWDDFHVTSRRREDWFQSHAADEMPIDVNIDYRCTMWWWRDADFIFRRPSMKIFLDFQPAVSDYWFLDDFSGPGPRDFFGRGLSGAADYDVADAADDEAKHWW